MFLCLKVSWMLHFLTLSAEDSLHYSSPSCFLFVFSDVFLKHVVFVGPTALFESLQKGCCC